MNELLSLVPDKSVAEIKEHIEQYQKYLQLNETKKDLISKYKVLLKDSKKSESKIDNKKPNVPLSKQTFVSNEERQQQREFIEKWKKEKENETVNKEKERKEEEYRK